ncbi:MAG: hypothetical protein M3247_03535, partial [Thermoproteota archaeon]|nr:hypothetical protein [Thermoproteota archaeon]
MKKEVAYVAVLFIIIITLLVNVPPLAAGQAQPSTAVVRLPEDDRQAAVNDRNLKLETVATGLSHPTALTFFGSSNDILVTEKDGGTVRRIIDDHVQKESVVKVAVANDNGTNERGLLGMAIAEPYVFLYYTESGDGRIGSDSKGLVPAGNRIYRYDIVEEQEENRRGTDHTILKLVNPKLLLDLPARPGPRYEGGKLLVRQEQNDGTANNTNNNSTTTTTTTTSTATIYLQIGHLD